MMIQERPSDALEREAQKLEEELREQQLQEELTENTPVSCPHTVLMPRWNAIKDMGKLDKVIGYRCDGCGEELSLDEGRDAIEKGAILMGSFS